LNVSVGIEKHGDVGVEEKVSVGNEDKDDVGVEEKVTVVIENKGGRYKYILSYLFGFAFN
jgi:hypothetical protein